MSEFTTTLYDEHVEWIREEVAEQGVPLGCVNCPAIWYRIAGIVDYKLDITSLEERVQTDQELTREETAMLNVKIGARKRDITLGLRGLRQYYRNCPGGGTTQSLCQSPIHNLQPKSAGDTQQ